MTISPKAWLLAMLLVSIVSTVVGCGTGPMSQADLLRHGITRDDDDDEEESPPLVITSGPAAANDRPDVASQASEAEAPASERSDQTDADALAAASPSTSSAATASTPSAQSATQPSASAESTTTEAKPESISDVPLENASKARYIGSLLPIADRGLTVASSDSDRRAASASKIEAITKALIEWIENSRRLETNAIQNAQGRPVLSWRVKILPLLGYSDLYKQFDQSQPWDHPNNKRLLPYIPPEFISPERLDSNTNYQLFVGRQALFSTKELKFKSDLSDAPHIAMLAEVDDSIAVPWTSPFDYEVDLSKPVGEGLGGLRSDGFFFSWMSGQVALWPNPIDEVHLKKAITFEAGDSFPMARYQGYPPTSAGSSGRPSLGDVAGAVESVSVPTPAAPAINSSATLTKSDSVPTTSASIPPADSVLAAERKVRATYQDAFKQARSPVEFAKLAKDMHRQLTESALPPEDTYVGLRTAVKIAIMGRDPQLALKISDDLISRFDVSRAEVEANIVDGFLGDGGSLRTHLSKAAELLPTLEQLINHDISQDDFRDAAKKAKLAQMVLATVSDPETKYRWKVLRQRVDEGKRQLGAVARDMDVLASDPDNPKANASIGWYFCVIKNNWRDGLQMLAKTEDPDLRVLAQLETQEDAGRNRAIQLGDRWWSYGMAKKDDDLVFEAAMQRSRLWYSTAAANLNDGLDRIRANDRVERINRMIGKLPDLAGTPYSAL